MRYELNKSRSCLTIKADDEERSKLHEAAKSNPDFLSEDFERSFLEPLTCNSELNWIRADETGDMTDAPMLGMREAQKDEELVTERWIFTNYERRSILEDLRDNGQAFLSGGAINTTFVQN